MFDKMLEVSIIAVLHRDVEVILVFEGDRMNENKVGDFALCFLDVMFVVGHDGQVFDFFFILLFDVELLFIVFGNFDTFYS